MKATVYRGIGDKHELIPFEAGKTIAECFDFDLSNAVILKNGLIANKDDILAEGDVLLIRDIPLAPVAIVAAIVAIPLVAIGTVKIVGLIKDIQKAKQMQADAEKLSKSLRDEVKNIPYLRGAQNQIALGQTQPLILGQHLFTPYLATGTFSKIGGSTGKDQFFHMVLQAGFAKTVIKELSCDDVVLKKWDTDEPQQGVYNFDSGIFYDDKNKIEVVQDGSPFTTAEFNKVIHTETPNTTIDKADSENYPVGGYVFTLPGNTMAVELCILFRGLICYASDGAKLKRTVKMYPEYKIGNGAWIRFTFDQNGTASNTFSYMSLEQMRFVARKEFSFNEVKDVSEPILVRLLCDTARYEGSARDDVSLLWIQSEKYDKEKSINNFVPEEIVGSTERALSNLVGLKIKVTENNQDKLNKINMVLQSVAKTWIGSTWSVNKEPTRNPASLLLEVLTSDTHKASQIKESEIDLDSFGELYEYCEEKGFKFDIVLTEGQTKQEVCEMILENCNAILYKSITGLMTVAIDKPKENAIALFNSQNILSIENKKNIERKADGIKINYISRAGGYVNSSYLVMRDGQERTADSVLIELNTQGMTEYDHIVKYARKLLASELLQPKQTIIEVGKEGIYYTPLSKVLLQHDSLKVGKGNAEVKSLIVDGQDIVGLKLYEPVEYDENETNGMIIVGAQNGAHVFYSLKYTALESFTDTVELVEPIPLSASNKPQRGDILSYGLINGEFAKITTEMLIIGSEPTEDGHRLTLVDYNEAVYETGAIPAYEPSFTTSTNFEATKPVLDGTPIPPTMDELQEVNSGLNNSIESIVNGTADVGRPDQIENIRATASRDGISFYCDILSDGLKNTFGRIDWEIKASGEQWSSARKLSTTVFSGTYNFDRVRDGYPEKDAVGLWEVRAKAVNGYGFESEFYSAVAVVNADGYGTWIQENPTVFNVQSANRSVNMSWQRPVNNLGKEIYGLKYYEIQISKNGTNWYKPAVNKTGKDSESDWYDGTGQLRNDSANYTQSLPLTGQTLSMPENTTYYFRVRTVGETNTSSWSDTQTGIALATGIGDVVAKAIKTEQLADSAVTNVQIKDGSIVASDKVVANSITTDKLNVLAKNKINNFSITGSLEGWSASGWDLIDYEGFKALRFKGAAPTLTSNNFEVLPTDIYSFEFGFATPKYLDTIPNHGQLIGLTRWQRFNQYEWNNTTKKWGTAVSTDNAYFVIFFYATELNLMKTYILGSAVSIDDVPAPSFDDGFRHCRCLQLTGTDTTAHVRTLTDRPSNPDNERIFYMPQIYNINSGKITANQVVARNLSSISADIGTITSGNLQSVIKPGENIPNVFLNLDTEEFRVGTNPSKDNTDEGEYLHYKPGVGFFLKIKNFIVTSISSMIRGIFKVYAIGKQDSESAFVVNPSDDADPSTGVGANTTYIGTDLSLGGRVVSDLNINGKVRISNPVEKPFRQIIKEKSGVIAQSFHGTGKNDLAIIEDALQKGHIEVKILSPAINDQTPFGGTIFNVSGTVKEVHSDRLQEQDWNIAKSWAEETRSGKAWRLPTRAELSLINPSGAWWTGETSGDEVYLWEDGNSNLVNKQGFMEIDSFFNAKIHRNTKQLVDTKIYIPQAGGTALEIIDTTNNTVTRLAGFFNASRWRRTSQLVGTKIYIPGHGGTALEIIDTTNNTVTTYDNFFNASRSRTTSQVVGTKIYIPEQTALSIIDTTNNTVTTIDDFFNASRIRFTSQVVGTKIYIPQAGGTALEIIDTTNNTVTRLDSFFNASRSRYICHLVGTKIYIPHDGGTGLEIIDTTNNTVTTIDDFFNASRIRFTSQVVGTKIYIPQSSGTGLETIETANNTVTTIENFFNASRTRVVSQLVGTKIYIPEDLGTGLEITDTRNFTTNTLPVRNNTETQRRQVSSSSDGTTWTIRSTALITAGQTFTSYFGLKLRFAGDTHKVGDYWRYEQDEMGAFSLQDSNGVEYVKATAGKLWVKEFVNTITVPIGFIYMQLPEQETPANLFGGTWQNISSDYPGLFFRVEGGSASAFGTAQSDAMQNISGIFKSVLTDPNSGFSATGPFYNGGTPRVRGWSGQDSDEVMIIGFDASRQVRTATETRPVNKTIRIWRRTA